MTASSSGRRREILSLLQESSAPQSIADIADALELHPNTVRFHLDALLERGRIERVTPRRTGPGRPALLFTAGHGMDPEGPRNYQLLAGILAGSLAGLQDPSGTAADAGRAWGRQLTADAVCADEEDATSRLVEILDDLGFAPERTGRSEIGLRHCPFLELVDNRRDVICPVHLGLMQGAMENLSTSVSVERLDPFVEPNLCLTHLGRAAS
jgi:predicted ArsR family transcriptional regulator